MSGFDNTYDLESFLREESVGEILLPYFQRGAKWEPVKQRALIASILAGAPIGSVLLISGPKNQYASRRLCEEKGSSNNSEENCRFLLDGQQRAATIKSVCDDVFFDCAGSDGFRKRYESVSKVWLYRWFIEFPSEAREGDRSIKDNFALSNLEFVDSVDELEPNDFEDCIRYEKILKTGTSWFHPRRTSESTTLIGDAVNSRRYPLWLIFSRQAGKVRIRTEILKGIGRGFHGVSDSDESENGKKRIAEINDWAEAVDEFIRKRFEKAQFPSITLPDKKINLAIAVFEQLNRGGEPLSAYDLIAARVARVDQEKSLTDWIEKKLDELKGTPCSKIHPQGRFNECREWSPKDWEKLGVWKNGEPTSRFTAIFLNCLGIECALAKGKNLNDLENSVIRKKGLLRLTANDIEESREKVMDGINYCLQFLVLRCGIPSVSEFPHQLMVLPLYIILRNYDSQKNPPPDDVVSKCEYWYWVSLFAGIYREDPSTIAMEDCALLHAWCSGDSEGHANGLKIMNRRKDVLKATRYSDYEAFTSYLPSSTPEAESSERGDMNSSITNPFLQFLLASGLMDWGAKEKDEPPKLISAWEFAKKDAPLEKHHIMPKEGTRDKDDPINSPLNQTYLLEKTNGYYLHALQLYDHIDSKGFKGHLLDASDLKDLSINYGQLPKKYGALKTFIDKRWKKFEAALNRKLDELEP